MRQPTLLLFMSIQNRWQAIQEPGNSIQGLRASDSVLEARDSTLRTGVGVRQPSTEQASTTTPCRQCEMTCPHVISNRYALRQFTLIRFGTRGRRFKSQGIRLKNLCQRFEVPSKAIQGSGKALHRGRQKRRERTRRGCGGCVRAAGMSRGRTLPKSPRRR